MRFLPPGCDQQRNSAIAAGRRCLGTRRNEPTHRLSSRVLGDFWRRCYETEAVTTALLFVLGLPALAVDGYLGMLGILAAPAARGKSGTLPEVLPHITFVVPAHNEALGISRTVKNLFSVDYAPDRFAVLVIADNCSDDTAQQAAAVGARVIERQDSNNRGKGYALQHAFELLIKEGTTDAVVVVDADTEVTANLLQAVATRLHQGEVAVQAHYGVRNAGESWRTQLMDLAFTLYHGVRSHARERMKVSAGLRGNGMGFSIGTLARVPHHSYSLVEDVEYGVQLGLHGIRVAYIGDAEVRADMVAGAKGSDTQRQRWEQGRQLMLKKYLPPLLRRGVLEGNGMLLDLAFDLVTPPLVTVVLLTSAGAAITTTLVITGLAQPIALVPWALSLLGLSVYVARGIQMSSEGPQAVLSLLKHGPRYALWKLALRSSTRKSSSKEWIRTRRTGEE